MNSAPGATGSNPTMQSVPVVESDRLILRGFQESDFEPMSRFYADPMSAFYGGPCDREEGWRKFAAYAGHWMLRGYGPWALEEKATGDFVGLSGLWYPEGWIEPELTWALVPGKHGKGFATEAALAALGAAYEVFGWTRAVSVIAKDNHASVAVATRMGATFEREVDFRYGKANLYVHPTLDQLNVAP